MDQNATRRLITSMRDSGKLLPETVEEMDDYLEELKDGPLDKMDTEYLQGLAQRLGFASGGTAPAAASDEDDADDDEAGEWADDVDDADDDALAEATDRIEALEARLAAAQTAVGRARDLFGEIKGAPDADKDESADAPADSGPMDALGTALDEAADALAERA